MENNKCQSCYGKGKKSDRFCDHSMAANNCDEDCFREVNCPHCYGRGIINDKKFIKLKNKEWANLKKKIINIMKSPPPDIFYSMPNQFGNNENLAREWLIRSHLICSGYAVEFEKIMKEISGDMLIKRLSIKKWKQQ